MRVVIAKKLLSTVGGSEALARGLATALLLRGHDVSLVGLRPPWRRPGIPEAAYRSRGDSTIVESGLRFTFLGTRFSAIDSLFPTSLVRPARFREAVAGANLVHSIAREWAGQLERAARDEGAAFVETPLVHPGQPWSGAGSGDLRRYRRDDAVLALTEWEAAWYRERGVEQAFTTGAGAVLAPLPAVPADPATVLFVGRKERYKGYDALRAAAPLVWRVRPDARFVLIGQTRFMSPRPLADPRWDERGVVSEADKAEAYARCTLFCMPSEHETFGLGYLEAWHAGKPVIAGGIPPVREIVREGQDGLHVANSPGPIARAILELLGDPERARQMGARGRERAARWTWSAVAERTEEAYRAAVQRNASR